MAAAWLAAGCGNGQSPTETGRLGERRQVRHGGAPSGIGYVLNLARQNLDSPTVFASIFVLMLLVYVVQVFIINRLEHWLTPHRRAGRTLLSA